MANKNEEIKKFFFHSYCVCKHHSDLFLNQVYCVHAIHIKNSICTDLVFFFYICWCGTSLLLYFNFFPFLNIRPCDSVIKCYVKKFIISYITWSDGAVCINLKLLNFEPYTNSGIGRTHLHTEYTLHTHTHSMDIIILSFEPN